MQPKRELLKKLKEIEQDCLKLKEKNDLTEFGKGELHILQLIKDYLKM